MQTCPGCGHENIDGAEVCEDCAADLTHLSKPRARSSVERSLHKIPVGALKSHSAVVVPSDRKVRDVIASLVLHQDGCAVVVDEAGQAVGVFSERDLVAKIAGRDDGLLDHPVAEFMTPDPVTVESSAPLAYALHQMELGGYRHLPLVEGKRPVGMVSIRDIVTHLCNKVLDDNPPAK